MINKVEYFSNFQDITMSKVVEILEYLDELEDNNDWLPSPHTIEPYIDFVQDLGMEGWTDELLELEHRLCDHFQGAYEQ